MSPKKLFNFKRRQQAHQAKILSGTSVQIAVPINDSPMAQRIGQSKMDQFGANDASNLVLSHISARATTLSK
jgi:hypothetical protein